MELLVVTFILFAILTPVIGYFSQNLTKVAEMRTSSIAMNVAKEGVEKLLRGEHILGRFYVYWPNEGSFVDGVFAPTPQNASVRVIRMGSSPMTVSVNAGAATAVIPEDTAPGTIIPLSGESVSDLTACAITGGTTQDRFDVIWTPSFSVTVDEATWQAVSSFENLSTPLRVTVQVFRESETEASAELYTTIEGYY